MKSDGLNDDSLVQVPEFDDSVLAVGEHQPLVNVQLDVNDASLNISASKSCIRIASEGS